MNLLQEVQEEYDWMGNCLNDVQRYKRKEIPFALSVLSKGLLGYIEVVFIAKESELRATAILEDLNAGVCCVYLKDGGKLWVHKKLIGIKLYGNGAHEELKPYKNHTFVRGTYKETYGKELS